MSSKHSRPNRVCRRWCENRSPSVQLAGASPRVRCTRRVARQLPEPDEKIWPKPPNPPRGVEVGVPCGDVVVRLEDDWDEYDPKCQREPDEVQGRWFWVSETGVPCEPHRL